jgi:methylated-DNA-[protein]-cysteine S-methyltransferase
VVVPCHRLIGANGSLVKYGSGLARKRWLLAHEGVDVTFASRGGATKF